jgi:hypothetical protein
MSSVAYWRARGIGRVRDTEGDLADACPRL